MIIFVHVNGGVPYDDWPKEYQLPAAIERLKRRGYLRRKYWPLRYGLSRSGYTIYRWLMASLEHANPNSSVRAAGA